MVSTVKSRGIDHGSFGNIKTIVTPEDVKPKTISRSDNDKAFLGKLKKISIGATGGSRNFYSI